MSEDNKYKGLRCPECGSELVGSGAGLSCGGCNASYDVIDGVPVFYREQSSNEDLLEMERLVGVMEERIDDDVHDIAEKFFLPNNKFSKAYLRAERKSFRNFESFFPDFRKMRILNLSSGIGRDAQFLIEMGCDDIYLSDISLPAVRYSKKVFEKYYPDARLEYFVADCSKIPYPDGYFDLVVVYSSIHHYPDLDAFIKEMRRVSSNLCILSEPAVMGGVNWVLDAVGWNTEYGEVDTIRVDENQMRALLTANGFEVDVERLWVYFPKMLSFLADNDAFISSWFAMLAVIDRLFPSLSHSINLFAKKI